MKNNNIKPIITNNMNIKNLIENDTNGNYFRMLTSIMQKFNLKNSPTKFLTTIKNNQINVKKKPVKRKFTPTKISVGPALIF